MTDTGPALMLLMRNMAANVQVCVTRPTFYLLSNPEGVWYLFGCLKMMQFAYAVRLSVCPSVRPSVRPSEDYLLRNH